jgi:hypothetical protein
MYVVVDGGGEVKEIELKETFRQLLETKVGEGESVWFSFLYDGEPSPSMLQFVELANKVQAYYHVVCAVDAELPKVYSKADDVHKARRPHQRVIDDIKKEPSDGEDVQLLFLLGEEGEVDKGSELDYLLTTVNRKMGIEVLDLAAQMIPIDIGEPGDDVPDEPEEGDPVEAAEVNEMFEGITERLQTERRAELMTLSRKELQGMVKEAGVTPIDMRSKASLVDALMRDWTADLANENDPDAQAITRMPITKDSNNIHVEGNTIGESDRGVSVSPGERLRGDARQHRASQSYAASPAEAAEANEGIGSALAVSIQVVEGLLQLTIDAAALERDLAILIKANGSVSFS